MPTLEIRTIGDPVLEKIAEPVATVDAAVRDLINDMLDTLRESHGVGLAAPQVGVSRRVVVMEIQGIVYKMVNPEITFREGKVTETEGCLSVPEVDGDVQRSAHIVAKYLDENGAPREVDATELLSRCIQHELDHLDGVLFVTRLGMASRLLLKKRLSAMRRDTQEKLKATEMMASA